MARINGGCSATVQCIQSDLSSVASPERRGATSSNHDSAGPSGIHLHLHIQVPTVLRRKGSVQAVAQKRQAGRQQRSTASKRCIPKGKASLRQSTIVNILALHPRNPEQGARNTAPEHGTTVRLRAIPLHSIPGHT